MTESKSNCGKLSTGRKSNKDMGREREFLTYKEVESLREAAKQSGRHGHRDYTAILLAYRHALRASELCNLTWDMLDLATGVMTVNRSKNGVPSSQVMQRDEIAALNKLRKEHPESRELFLTERGSQLSRDSFHDIVRRAGIAAGIPFPVHPHMLRHAKGYSLANKGHDTRAIQHWLGHKNIQHTVVYTNLDAGRLKHLAGD